MYTNHNIELCFFTLHWFWCTTRGVSHSSRDSLEGKGSGIKALLHRNCSISCSYPHPLRTKALYRSCCTEVYNIPQLGGYRCFFNRSMTSSCPAWLRKYQIYCIVLCYTASILMHYKRCMSHSSKDPRAGEPARYRRFFIKIVPYQISVLTH